MGFIIAIRDLYYCCWPAVNRFFETNISDSTEILVSQHSTSARAFFCESSHNTWSWCNLFCSWGTVANPPGYSGKIHITRPSRQEWTSFRIWSYDGSIRKWLTSRALTDSAVVLNESSLLAAKIRIRSKWRILLFLDALSPWRDPYGSFDKQNRCHQQAFCFIILSGRSQPLQAVAGRSRPPPFTSYKCNTKHIHHTHGSLLSSDQARF